MGEENSRARHDMPLRRTRSKVYKSIASKKLVSLEFLCEYWNEEPAEPLDCEGNTLLHLLVISNSENALRKLMDDGDVSQAHLTKQNLRGETALHEAARHGNLGIVVLLLEKEMKLIQMLSCSDPMCNCEECAEKGNLASVPNNLGETALFLAAACGKLDIFKLILKYGNDDCTTQRKDGCTVLHAAIMGEHYFTANKILRLDPVLAQKYNKSGDTALYILASSPSSFLGYSFYKAANMGKVSMIILRSLRAILFWCIPHMYTLESVRKGDEEDSDRRWKAEILEKERNPFVNLLLRLPWIQEIDDKKRKKFLAVALAKQLLEEEVDWSRYTYSSPKDQDQNKTPNKVHSNPLMRAIEMGIPELVEEILRYIPGAANSIDKDGRNVFHYAAEHRAGDIYEKLKVSVVNKDRMLSDVDYKGNTILHYATKIMLSSSTNLSIGIANLLTWEVFWFQRIRHDCPPHLFHMRNNDGCTAEDLLLKYYNNKREAVVKEVKEMNQGVMVVAALIATVSFAAVFTIPGGFDQNNGTPLYYKQKDHHYHELNQFFDAVWFTFFASVTSLGTLLTTQLSRFHWEDLYLVLPLRYLIALLTLFLSAGSIALTFHRALILMGYLTLKIFRALLIIFSISGLFYVDPTCYVFSYIVEVLRHSKPYKSVRT
ncbi:uncharacterized protein LOC108195430 isoform X2 [Daucus carota subsp. sativus]